MSAYAHQMEREYSARSLSNGENSGTEMGSRYVMESGFYMTSFAATIFIAGLVTVGVLLITLLIALTVMLQSCQSKSSGVVEIQKASDDYNDCKIFALYAELNSLKADEFPSICREFAIQYIRVGQYARDLNATLQVVENYFSSIMPLNNGLDVVLIDIDDILSSNPHHTNLFMHRFDQFGCSDCIGEAKHLKHLLIFRLYMKLQASGWPLILLSRKSQRQQNATVGHLISAGYSGWTSLIMRLDDEASYDLRSYSSSYPQTQMGGSKRDLKLKKGKSTSGSSSKSWAFGDPEFQRKKRVASYKMYSVEGKVKGSFRRSFRWLKDKYTQVLYGWW